MKIIKYIILLTTFILSSCASNINNPNCKSIVKPIIENDELIDIADSINKEGRFYKFVFRSRDELKAKNVESLLKKENVNCKVNMSRKYYLLVEEYNEGKARNLIFGEPFIEYEPDTPYSWTEVTSCNDMLLRDFFKNVEVLVQNDISVQIYIHSAYYILVESTEDEAERAIGILEKNDIKDQGLLGDDFYESIKKERYSKRNVPPRGE